MPDPLIIAGAAAAFKSTFDALRSAMGLLKDAKELLPPGDQRQQAITQALATAESSSKIAEAEIAKALGYELCKCEFPPTIMLTVGEHLGRPKTGPVYECPKCGFNSAVPFMYSVMTQMHPGLIDGNKLSATVSDFVDRFATKK